MLTYQLLLPSVLTWNLEAGALTNPAAITPDTSPRGIKRSRSPDTYGDLPPSDGLGDDGTSSLVEEFGSYNLLSSLRL
jgi:hypothetical protein